jgi:hypothetical protein
VAKGCDTMVEYMWYPTYGMQRETTGQTCICGYCAKQRYCVEDYDQNFYAIQNQLPTRNMDFYAEADHETEQLHNEFCYLLALASQAQNNEQVFGT